jgi:hypothetical protein
MKTSADNLPHYETMADFHVLSLPTSQQKKQNVQHNSTGQCSLAIMADIAPSATRHRPVRVGTEEKSNDGSNPRKKFQRGFRYGLKSWCEK